MWVSQLRLSHPSQFRGTALGEIPKLDCCLLMQEHVWIFEVNELRQDIWVNGACHIM